MVQIDKDIDINDILNWNQLPGNKNPGDGGEWSYVEWSSEPEARVIEIHFWHIKGGDEYHGHSNAFGDLKKLQRIRIGIGVGITGLGNLGGLPELTHLELWNNSLTSLDGIVEAPNLEYVELNNNRIFDIGGIAKAKNLKYIELNNNCISDISGIAKVRNLEYISLDNNCLVDVHELEKSNSLKGFSVRRNGIEKLDVSNMKSLQGFVCAYNRIFDLGEFKTIQYIEGILANNNRLTKLNGFECLSYLDTLDVNYNRLPLSQLFICMYVPNLHLGTQTDVALPSLSGSLFTEVEYDLRSEYRFSGNVTEFSLFSQNMMKVAVRGTDYTITDGILVFLTPGEYVLSMRNEAIHSQGRVDLYDRGEYGSYGISAEFNTTRMNPYGENHPLATVITEPLVVRTQKM